LASNISKMLGLSTTELILIVLAIVLLFGASRLPQLAKSLGQSRRAFKDAFREGEENDALPVSEPKQVGAARAAALSDEEILAEMQRRAAARAEV